MAYQVTIEPGMTKSGRIVVIEWPDGQFLIDTPVQYENGVIAYDHPESLPNRVKRMVERSFHHKPGNLRFCNENCQSGFFEDRKRGLVYFRDVYLEDARNGYCCYCRSYVLTNQDKRSMPNTFED